MDLSLIRTRHRSSKLLASIGLLCVSVVFLGLSQTKAPGPDESVLVAVPLFAWVALAIGVIGVCATLLFHKPNSKKVPIVALTILILLYFGLYLAPLFTGASMYASFAFDQLVHLGRMRDLVAGTPLVWLRYPATYLLGSSIVMVTGLPLSLLSVILSFIFTILLLFAVYFTSVSLTGNVWVGRAAIVAGIPLYFDEFQISVMPWFFGLVLLPLLLGTVHRSATTNSRRDGVAAVVLALGLTIYHPFSALLGVVTLFAYGGIRSMNGRQTLIPGPSFNFSFLLGVLIAAWLVFTGAVGAFVREIAAKFLLETASAGAVNQVQRFGTSNRTLLETIWQFVVMEWGAVFILLGLGAVATGAILLEYTLRGRQPRPEEILFGGGYVFGVALAASFIIVSVFGFGPVRSNQYSILFAIFLVPLLFVGLRENLASYLPSSIRQIAHLGVVILILTAPIISFAGVYEQNNLMTSTDEAVSTWMLEQQNPQSEVYSGRVRNKYQRYYYGDRRGVEKRQSGYLLANRTHTIESMCSPRCSGFHRSSYLITDVHETSPKVVENVAKAHTKIYSNRDWIVVYANASKQ